MSMQLQTNGVSSTRRRVVRRLATSLFVVGSVWSGVSGCASQIGATGFGSDVGSPTHGVATANHIGRLELTPYDQASLEDVVSRLRPDWLRANPSSRQLTEPARAAIYIDNVYSGEPGALRLVPVDAVVELWLLRPLEAIGRFGPGCRCTGGVILVQTRAGRAGAR